MTRFRSLAGIVAGLALPGALVGTAVAGTPQEDVLSAFESGSTPSASTLIQCIDDAYHGLAEGTFRTDMQFRIITRVLGQPDITSTGSASVVNQETDLRFEADHNVVARRPGKGDIPPFFGRAESRFVFVRHGDEVRSLETGVPTARDQFVTNAFKIDLSGFSPEVQERITGPFATPGRVRPAERRDRTCGGAGNLPGRPGARAAHQGGRPDLGCATRWNSRRSSSSRRAAWWCAWNSTPRRSRPATSSNSRVTSPTPAGFSCGPARSSCSCLPMPSI